MQSYKSHLVFYKQNPFITVVDDKPENAWQFVKDYCRANGISLVADEWIVIPHTSIISKSILDSLARATHPMNTMSNLPPWQAVEGVLKVKPHPGTWSH